MLDTILDDRDTSLHNRVRELEGKLRDTAPATKADVDELHVGRIAPGGKVLYRHNGPVDAVELRAKVIEALGGAYYTPPPAPGK